MFSLVSKAINTNNNIHKEEYTLCFGKWVMQICDSEENTNILCNSSSPSLNVKSVVSIVCF